MSCPLWLFEHLRRFPLRLPHATLVLCWYLATIAGQEKCYQYLFHLLFCIVGFSLHHMCYLQQLPTLSVISVLRWHLPTLEIVSSKRRNCHRWIVIDQLQGIGSDLSGLSCDSSTLGCNSFTSTSFGVRKNCSIVGQYSGGVSNFFFVPTPTLVKDAKMITRAMDSCQSLLIFRLWRRFSYRHRPRSFVSLFVFALPCASVERWRSHAQ